MFFHTSWLLRKMRSLASSYTNCLELAFRIYSANNISVSLFTSSNLSALANTTWAALKHFSSRSAILRNRSAEFSISWITIIAAWRPSSRFCFSSRIFAVPNVRIMDKVVPANVISNSFAHDLPVMCCHLGIRTFIFGFIVMYIFKRAAKVLRFFHIRKYFREWSVFCP